MTKSSTSPKIPDFQNGGKSPWRSVLYLGSKLKSLQRWNKNFLRFNILLRTRGQKMNIFLTIDRRPKGHFLKSCSFLVENRQK